MKQKKLTSGRIARDPSATGRVAVGFLAPNGKLCPVRRVPSRCMPHHHCVGSINIEPPAHSWDLRIGVDGGSTTNRPE